MSQERQVLKDEDLRIDWFSGTGAGGQHRNKCQNSCRVTHMPSGLIETRQGRKRSSNLSQAKAALEQRLSEARKSHGDASRAADKKQQVGSGMRADKVVTIRMQDDRVTHHGTGKTMSAKQYMAGKMDKLWV